ncbi:MAG: hypothetical protein AYL32_005450 [Candidatus Bathyarchaeota archaeon B26-2]|nr:MAG: hypothetical protein AYL32_005450 [Candidatus Bathyarchaeota archaeon B26-2]
MFDYAGLEEILREEIRQRREEGCEVSRIERKLLNLKSKDPSTLERLLEETAALTPNPEFPYVEPSSLPEIRRMRPRGPRRLDVNLSESSLLDKIYGAWLGRSAGCLLGKPVEGWSRGEIEEYLRLAGAYPLKNYVPLAPNIEKYAQRIKGDLVRCTLGNIEMMVRDDDLDYTILGLHVLETYGVDFTTEDVAKEWLTHLPYLCVYTAERAAYRNLVNGLKPPKTAVYMNPYREWIGAQIRADIWGYVTPGMPELGAELAYRDASLSHVKNGIYGEMFVSAMLSASFVTDDLEEILRIGLSEVPQRSRLAEAVRDVMRWSKRFSDWRDSWERIMEKYGHYHPVHTINNAAVVTLGLLYGDGDFERSITISVMSGLDTDCNGATVGSILGATLGADALPEKWTKPINDTVESYVAGFGRNRISDLARRTLKLAKSIRRRGLN